MDQSALRELIEATIAREVPAPVRAMAEHLRLSCGYDVAAVLAYGSCLRGVDPGETLIDLYVVTRSRKGLGFISGIFCSLIPPNVYYAEHPSEGRLYRAKYAVVPLAVFARWMEVSNPYFWARFSQPVALVFAAERAPIVSALATATARMFAQALGLGRSATDSPLSLWERGYRATYRTELRAEGPDRAKALIDSNADYYLAAADILRAIQPLKPKWRRLEWQGKLWSILRLLKASFTFQGGADYLAWKIERHSGEKIALSPWQRRHPILAGIVLLPRLLKRGAVR